MLGNAAVGKTSLVRRFVYDRFDDRYLSTIGVKISRKNTLLSDGRLINFILWDLAGGDDFNDIHSSYLEKTAGALIVCDLTRVVTMDALGYYQKRLFEVVPNCPIVIVGNKADLTRQFEISRKQLTKKAAELGAPLVITSAKTGEGVENAFDILGQKITKPSQTFN